MTWQVDAALMKMEEAALVKTEEAAAAAAGAAAIAGAPAADGPQTAIPAFAPQSGVAAAGISMAVAALLGVDSDGGASGTVSEADLRAAQATQLCQTSENRRPHTVPDLPTGSSSAQ